MYGIDERDGHMEMIGQDLRVLIFIECLDCTISCENAFSHEV